MIRIKQPAPAAALMVALLTASVWMTSPALADQKVDRTVKAAADGLVTVENIAGSIEIVGWNRKEVKIEGNLTGDAEEVVVEEGKKTRIKVKYPRRTRNLKGGAELVIHVPADSRVDVECISADISVLGVKGVVEAESISGDVKVNGKCEALEAETISGNVTVDAEAPEMSVSSISGNIKVTGGVSQVEAETVSGNIRLMFRKFLLLDVESVSGNVEVAGDLDAAGSFSFELHSGNLVLTVPGDVSADFRVETFSGGIDNGFGQKSRKTSKYAPGREMEFTNGNGDARVEIDTFSGDVVIRKK